MLLTGLVWGVFRYSPSRAIVSSASSRHAVRRPDALAHYAGLIVGLACVHLNLQRVVVDGSVGGFRATAPTRQQRDAVAGGPLRLDAITIDRVRATLGGPERARPTTGRGGCSAAFQAARLPKRSTSRNSAAKRSSSLTTRPSDSDRDTMLACGACGDAGRDVRRCGVGRGVRRVLLRSRCSSQGALAAGAARRYADPQRTWLYLDPRRGAIVRKEERLTRVNRWLYHGLPQPRFPLFVLPSSALGPRRDRAQHRRHRAERDHAHPGGPSIAAACTSDPRRTICVSY